ncbi:MAG: 2-C-methyl-D-erythritol 4-phosphate cytidylyltransferase [Chloroflexi bacterium]|nr:2-C-methyl-D-erythritol 4-phosphate cytidylyltransferase [Chloroflexota bacterium]
MTASLDDPTGPQAQVGAVVAAGGASRRMEGRDKLFAPLNGVPLLAYSVEALEGCPSVGDIVVVLAERNLEAGHRLAKERGWRKVVGLCPGGLRRQDSVRRGLEALPPCQWVLVHDGARPFLDSDIILRGLAEARVTGAAVAAVPLVDTIKAVSSEGTVQATVDRTSLWAVQTPQMFLRALLERAHQEIQEGVTDDASMVERLGHTVRVFPGSHFNLKVTTPEDLRLAEALLLRRREGRCG